MNYRQLKKENARLSKAIGIANRTIFEQMEELRRLDIVAANTNTVNDARDAEYRAEIFKKDSIIEYLENKI